MELILVILIGAAIYWWYARRKPRVNISHLPRQFVVFDLETTGFMPSKHEIIEIGAIRVNRDSDTHDTFQVLIKPRKKIPKKITELTGISQEMIDGEGQSLESAVADFLKFAGDLNLVSFNAEFDMAFLRHAAQTYSVSIENQVSCALQMARRAWPRRRSYKLAELAKDGKLNSAGTHRALSDCQRALIVYIAAASRLGTVR